MRTFPTLAVLAALVVSPTVALRADDPRLQVDITGHDGAEVHLDLSMSWLKGALAFADVDCRSDVDAPTRAMAASLDSQGEGGFFEYDRRDGDHVLARRAKGELRLEVREHDRDRSIVELPWPLAQCWLLGREPAGGVGSMLAHDGLHVRIDARDGQNRIRLTLD